MSKKIVAACILAVLVIGSFSFLKQRGDSSHPAASKYGGTDLSSDKISKYTINNQNSIYFIVNKKRGLPSTFVPQNLVSLQGKQLRGDAANALSQLISAAAGDGVNFKIISGYRSYQYQEEVYGNYVKRDGQTKADTYSARPGHSEHQLGLAADLGTGVCDLQICFGNTKGGQWLLANSYKYGFVVRYQKGKENLTGYQYEPWHVRYVGIDLAEKIYKSGKTLEQFFGLPAPTSY